MIFFLNATQTPSVWSLCVLCVFADVGKRSSSDLPPVGGAQQSQVAVGGTVDQEEEEEVEDEETEEATEQQPASVCPKTG